MLEQGDSASSLYFPGKFRGFDRVPDLFRGEVPKNSGVNDMLFISYAYLSFCYLVVLNQKYGPF